MSSGLTLTIPLLVILVVAIVASMTWWREPHDPHGSTLPPGCTGHVLRPGVIDHDDNPCPVHEHPIERRRRFIAIDGRLWEQPNGEPTRQEHDADPT